MLNYGGRFIGSFCLFLYYYAVEEFLISFSIVDS